jgi:uncharacterized protein YcfJ
MKTTTRCLSALLSSAMFAGALALSGAASGACPECGTVSELKTIKKEGEGSGAGAVVGGVLGGVLGHQVGSGRGNTAATIVGAGAGAYAGNQVEKNQKTTTSYRVFVTLEGGATKYFTFAEPTSYRVGDKVKVIDGKLVRQQ